MSQQNNGAFGCIGLIGLVVVVGMLLGVVANAYEMTFHPEAYAAREAARVAEIAEQERLAQQAKLEREWEEFEAKEREAARRVAAEEARNRANRAALERYAECQVRNQTPGYCTEDWRPTEDIRAMNEIMREGRF